MSLRAEVLSLGYRCLLAIGIEVHPRREPLRFLARRPIRTVLDIGANEGQFAQRIRKLLPNARIYSFEPLPDVFRKLTLVAQTHSNHEAINVGVSDVSGEADFEANAFSQWSSFLTISPGTKTEFPRTARTTRIRVALTTLDEWAGARRLDGPLLVKIDVQGLEDRVIRGGIKTLTRADVIIVEVSFVRAYDGQALFDDIYCQMRSMGFRCAGMIEISSNRKTGELFQGDAIFVPASAADDDG